MDVGCRMLHNILLLVFCIPPIKYSLSFPPNKRNAQSTTTFKALFRKQYGPQMNAPLMQEKKKDRLESYYEPYWHTGDWVYYRGESTRRSHPFYLNILNTTQHGECNQICPEIFQQYGAVCGMKYNDSFATYDYRNFTDYCYLELENCFYALKRWFPVKKGECPVDMVTQRFDHIWLQTRVRNFEAGKYTVESLSPATFEGAIKVIKDAFCQDENVAIGSEVNKNPTAAEELLELCADAALDGVSVVAVDIENGEVVSVAFNKIQVKATDESEKPFFVIFAEERCTQASSRSLVEFMADVDERCNLFEKYKVDCSLEVMFLATLRGHRGKGLATLLTKASIDVARKIRYDSVAPLHVNDLGPKYSHLTSHKSVDTYPKICQAIWTGKGSRCIGKALNFTVHLTVPFTEFVFRGKSYSERIGDENEFCEVAALSL